MFKFQRKYIKGTANPLGTFLSSIRLIRTSVNSKSYKADKKKKKINKITHDVMDEYRKKGCKVRTRAEGVLKPPQVGENGGNRWAQCCTKCG